MVYKDIWSIVEKDNYQTYDAFVDLIKNNLAESDVQAYEIEDIINDCMVDAFNRIEKRINNK